MACSEKEDFLLIGLLFNWGQCNWGFLSCDRYHFRITFFHKQPLFLFKRKRRRDIFPRVNFALSRAKRSAFLPTWRKVFLHAHRYRRTFFTQLEQHQEK